MKIAFYGSSILSSYWNGAATYYRGLIRALSALGHDITFHEPDVYDRQKHRDISPPEWCRVVVYEASEHAMLEAAMRAADFDVVIKTSGIGYADDAILDALLRFANPASLMTFWDVDASATLAQMKQDAHHRLRAALPRLDMVLTYGGGRDVLNAYAAMGARLCAPVYNALDPLTHHRVAPETRFTCDLAFLGNRLPDREARVDAFFLEAARALPQQRFLLGGAGWGEKALPGNIEWIDHVPTADHNALNSSAGAILNVNRSDMAATGFSPPTRIFEAAGAGACIITDSWPGIETFLKPDHSIFIARDGQDVAEIMSALTPELARAVGERARAHVLAEHTYELRARQVEDLFVKAWQIKAEAA